MREELIGRNVATMVRLPPNRRHKGQSWPSEEARTKFAERSWRLWQRITSTAQGVTAIASSSDAVLKAIESAEKATHLL